MWSLLLSSPAFAFASESQHVVLEHLAELFTSVEYSTGPLPEGSPVAVQFSIESTGGADVRMEGDGDLTWPEALTLDFAGEPGSGTYVLDVDLAAVTVVIVDLSDWGYYGEFEIDRRELNFGDGAVFDPFVLQGGDPDRVSVSATTDSTQLIYYSYEIWAGISLNFEADMTPTVNAGFEGVSWTMNDEATILAAGQTVRLTPEQVASYLVHTVFRGAFDATLSLVFTPEISVSAPFIDDIVIARFDIPIDLATEQFEEDFAPTEHDFPLPWLEAGLADADFGEIEIGDLANVDLPLENAGDLLLEGTAKIEGATDFTVYPETFSVVPGAASGLVVTFAPTIEGEQAAELVLASNDPTSPEVRIPLVGNAFQPDEGGYADTGTIKASTSGCGCAATPRPAWLAGLAAAVLVGWRRRR